MKILTTYEEIDALPDGSIIRDAFDDIALKRDSKISSDQGGYVWHVLGEDRDRDGCLDLAGSAFFMLPVVAILPDEWPTL